MGNDVNLIVPVFKALGRVVIQYDNNKNANQSVSSLVIRLEGSVPYSSDKVLPYKYKATMIENEQEALLSAKKLVVSIADVVKVTHSGRVFGPISTKVMEDIVVGKKGDVPVVSLVNAPTCQSCNPAS